MRGVNKVVLIGNLGKDPDIQILEGNIVVAKFSLATTETFKDKSGQIRSETEWHTIILWRGLGELARKFLKKGSLVYVEGKLRTRSWEDKDGNKKFATEIVGDNLVMLEKKPGEEDADSDVDAEILQPPTDEFGQEKLPFKLMTNHFERIFLQDFTFLVISPSLGVVLGLLLLGFASVSFLMSGSEIAYFSLQFKDLNVVKTKADPSYKRVALLLEQPRKLQAVIFVCKVFSTIGFVVILDILLQQIFGAVGLLYWVAFLLRVVIIIIFVTVFLELIPRLWAAHRQISFASKSSLMLEIFGSVFYKYSSGLTNKTIAAEQHLKKQLVSELEDESIDEAIDQLSESEAGFAEKKILKGIRKFGDTAVRQIMKPRMDVYGIEESTSFAELLKIVADLNYSRLPVYRNNLDEPVGILHTKDIIPFIDNDDAYDWKALIRKTMFVHEQKSIEDLMHEFLSKRVHFAVVVDEFGGTSGIVTLEDIMEEIIGDIKDDFDKEEKVDNKIDEFTYVFDGKQIIEDACTAMERPTNSFDYIRGDSNTIGGLVLEIAGDFPEENTEFDTPNFIIIPLAISKNRIDKVKVIIKQEAAIL